MYADVEKVLNLSLPTRYRRFIEQEESLHEGQRFACPHATYDDGPGAILEFEVVEPELEMLTGNDVDLTKHPFVDLALVGSHQVDFLVVDPRSPDCPVLLYVYREEAFKPIAPSLDIFVAGLAPEQSKANQSPTTATTTTTSDAAGTKRHRPELDYLEEHFGHRRELSIGYGYYANSYRGWLFDPRQLEPQDRERLGIFAEIHDLEGTTVPYLPFALVWPITDKRPDPTTWQLLLFDPATCKVVMHDAGHFEPCVESLADLQLRP